MEQEKISGDGNCVCRCMSVWLYSSSEYHMYCRDIMCQEMVKNVDEYRDFVPGDLIAYHDFVEEQAHNRSWVGDIGIRALTNAYGCNTIIYDMLRCKVIYYAPRQLIIKDTWEIVYIDNNHYNLKKYDDGRNHAILLKDPKTAKFGMYCYICIVTYVIVHVSLHMLYFMYCYICYRFIRNENWL